MIFDRRQFMSAVAAGALCSAVPARAAKTAQSPMYGLIGKIRSVPGQRDALAAILVDGIAGMPGCLSYIVAKDPGDADAIWVTEVWDSQASHTASLSLPSVKTAIDRARPLIAGFDQRIETTPVGGHGIAAAG